MKLNAAERMPKQNELMVRRPAFGAWLRLSANELMQQQPIETPGEIWRSDRGGADWQASEHSHVKGVLELPHLSKPSRPSCGELSLGC